MMDAIDVIAILFLRISLILLIFALVNVTAFKADDSFIVKPDKEVYRREGSDVTLEWQFHVGSWRSSSHTKITEFLFGEWVPPGYIRNKILAVQKYNMVLKRRGFEKKVDWSGDILGCMNCTAKVKMYNLTAADFKTYGVEVELSLDRSPLTNWLKLEKFVPAEIIQWNRSENVEESKATTIECKATGRPTPSVIIKRKNQNLCKNTGHCIYDIPVANKSVHEGEYLCLVQQRKYSSQIRRSSYLTVLDGRKRPLAKNIADVQHTEALQAESRVESNIPSEFTFLSHLVIFVFGVLVAVAALRKTQKHDSHSKQD